MGEATFSNQPTTEPMFDDILDTLDEILPQHASTSVHEASQSITVSGGSSGIGPSARRRDLADSEGHVLGPDELEEMLIERGYDVRVELSDVNPSDRVVYLLSKNDPMDLVPDTEEIAKRIAPYGDVDNGIRRSKPESENGLIQYIWRQARFHSGADMHMPVTDQFWLSSWMEDNGFKEKRGDRDKVREMEKKLEPVIAKVIVEEFGLSDLEAAKRWRKAGLI